MLLGLSICPIFLIRLTSSFFSNFTYKTPVLQLSQVPQNISHLHCPIHPCIHHRTMQRKGEGEPLTKSLRLSDLDVVILVCHFIVIPYKASKSFHLPKFLCHSIPYFHIIWSILLYIIFQCPAKHHTMHCCSPNTRMMFE